MDVRLASYDVAGSIAHARGLHAAGLLTREQLAGIEGGLRQVAEELASGAFAFRETDEDIHTAVERRLTELDPDAGARLHTGRSRNDQVALDLRLFCRDACGRLAGAASALVDALARQAVVHARLPMTQAGSSRPGAQLWAGSERTLR